MATLESKKKMSRHRARMQDPKYRRQYIQKKVRRKTEMRQDDEYWERELAGMRKRRQRRTYRTNLVGPDIQAIRELAESAKTCAICQEERPLHVDHCHRTGFVRGMICGGCNTALGRFRDDPAILRRALLYLEKSPILKKKLRYERRWSKRKPHLEE